MVTKPVAGVAGLPQSSNINGCDSVAAEKRPSETAGNPSDCRTALLAARANVDALRKLRPDLRWICSDIASLIDCINISPGDIFARRQLAERYAEINRRTTDNRAQ